MSMSRQKFRSARPQRIAQRVRHLRVLEDISASLKRVEEHLNQERIVPDEQDDVKQSSGKETDSGSGQGIVISEKEEEAIRRKYYKIPYVRMPYIIV